MMEMGFRCCCLFFCFLFAFLCGCRYRLCSDGTFKVTFRGFFVPLPFISCRKSDHIYFDCVASDTLSQSFVLDFMPIVLPDVVLT